MTGTNSRRRVHLDSRAAMAARRMRAWGAVVGVAAVVAACDEGSVVAPPATVADALLLGVSESPLRDREILVALYEATDGPNWVNSDNWLTDAPLGAWYGVDTDASGRVVQIHLAGSWDSEANEFVSHGLRGSIPPEVGGLTNLEILYLADNHLTGSIPAELGDLANLGELSLGYNELTGPIPPELGDLANLQLLFLWYNELSGPIPEELGRMAMLEALALDFNQLTGTVPSSFAGLSQLQLFLFRANAGLCLPANLVGWYEAIKERDGPVCPDADVLRALYESAGGGGWANADGWLGDGPLGEWYGVGVDASGRVSTVDLAGNGLTGSLPRRLGDLTGLTTLRIGDNALSGRLPFSLAATPLQELRYANTDLCVPAEARFREWLLTVPQHDGTGDECPPLSDREILIGLYDATGGPEWANSGNWLTDAPLGEWYGVRAGAGGRVVGLELGSNGLVGPIPPELGGLAELDRLILSDNELTGPIPPELGALARVKVLTLAGNQLAGPIPPELGGLAAVEVLWLDRNRLTGAVPAELGMLANLAGLLLHRNQLASIPAEVGRLAKLEDLNLSFNELVSVPAELGQLRRLRWLDLEANLLTTLPVELGQLSRLVLLSLGSNELTSLPGELGRLSALEELWLGSNDLTSLPGELGRLGSLRLLDLEDNLLAAVPAGLGRLSELEVLWLGSNGLTSLPGELGELGNLRELYLDGNRLTGLPAGFAGFTSLEIVDLSSNEMSGSLPAAFVDLRALTSLGVADNAGLTGALPLELTALERLQDLHTTGTGLCAPTDPTFLDWLGGVTRQRVELCSRVGGAAAYLTQVVQSREFPVPLVAGEPAMLRVFVTARAGNTSMPPVRATFYRDGAVVHVADIPATSDPIPVEIDEGSLSKSVNAEIPGWVIQPGLEVVIEPDPEGTLDAAVGLARRIPATGRMAVDVHAVPVLELTLLPFLWERSTDTSILEITAAMADDPEGHELLEHTHLLLPVAAIDVRAHGSVATSTNDGVALMEQAEMIRVAEGGRGHYLAVMAPPTTPPALGGVAYDIGSWTSFSVLDSETIAHELGHNRNLYHAPCGGAGGPDRYYPYGAGNIGAWGYDPRVGELVPPGQSDLMSYCDPLWISDYQFTNALRYRLETENSSILVAAATPPPPADRALLLWGGLGEDGTPYLRPVFFIDAPPTLPEAGGPYSLTGRDLAGTELFSLSFAMAEFTDAEGDRGGFSFALPVRWAGELARITLQGPGGSARLDGDTNDPLTILRDPATGQIRGVVDGPPPPGPAAGPAPAPGPELEVLFSRGIPSAANEQR